MQVQGKLRKILNFCGYLAVTSLLISIAGADLTKRCFDFSTKIIEPLRAPVTSDQAGKLPQGWDWAATHALIDQPIEAVLKDLLGHVSTKSPRVNKMQIKDLGDSRYLAKQEVHYEVDPFPFVSVKWVEDWAFALTQGTPQRPDRVVISYEKAEGTSHIEHLCGNYVIQRVDDQKTDLFIYEEGKATGRTDKDTLNGLKGNVKALEKLKGH